MPTFSLFNYLLTGTTTPMFNHLQAHHKEEWEECNLKKRKQHEAENASTHRKRHKSGLSLAEKSEIDELLMEMIAIDLKPFSCVEDRGFRKLLKKLAPDYEPPCRTTFSRTRAPILYHKIKEKLMEELHEDLQNGLTSISFTTDGWKSMAHDHYLSLTLHYLTKDFTQKNITLGMEQIEEKHTGRNLKNLLEQMMSEWRLLDSENLPVYFVTDNAKNITSAISQGHWEHICCFAHTLQLALKDAKNSMNKLDGLLKKVSYKLSSLFNYT